VSKTGNGAWQSISSHHARRRLRERSETRLSRVEDPEKNPVRAQRPNASNARRELEVQESPVQESSVQKSSNPESSQPRGALAREFTLPNVLSGIGIRTAAAVGFSAIVALLFVVLMPEFRRSDTASSFSADVRQFTAALPPGPQDRPPQDRSPQDRPPRDQQSSEDATKAVIAQFQRLLAPSGAPAVQADRDPSDQMLQRFMQWRLKAGSADNAQ
jgi:hypothetical protein